MSGTLHSFCIVADDLSGAADCAAAFARVSPPVTVRLGSAAGPQTAGLAIDTDTRAMDRAQAVAATARAFEQIARSVVVPQLVYKKIDSTLRGHVGAELQAALAASSHFAGAVVAPAFPEQGRTLDGGKLHVHGRPADGFGHSGDLLGMLDAAGLQPALLSRPQQGPAQLRQWIGQALRGGARAVVVDAAEPRDLARLAAALCLEEGPRLLAAGSAGLARALAQHVRPHGPSSAAPPACGPVLALVGSFSAASAAQVQQAEAAGDVRVIRLDASQWLDDAHAALRRRALQDGEDRLRGGGNLVFAIGGTVAQPFSRALVRGMARTTAPLLQHAGTCFLTGGDTARALFDELGVDELQVTGEFEPGISLARISPAAAPGFVLKAGGFGDALALQRIIRHCGARRRPSLARESARS